MGYPQGSFSYGAAIGLFIPLQLPLSPMGVFAIGIEHALDIAVLRRCIGTARTCPQSGGNRAADDGRRIDPSANTLRL
jgi:hypothetical protein